MVPRTVGAHLDLVTGELVDLLAEPLQLLGAGDAPPVRAVPPESVTVDVGNHPQAGFLTDGAVALGLGSHVAGGPHQLGVRVAEVEARLHPVAVVPQQRPALERVVDLSGHRSGV